MQTIAAARFMRRVIIVFLANYRNPKQNTPYSLKYPKMDNDIRLREDTRLYYARVINKVDEYCEAHLHNSFGISQLADYVHMSYHHLTDVFYRIRNTSLGNYILSRRLERAAQFSCYTPLNLSEISEKTGFATKHSLSKAFKNKFATSPGQLGRQSLYHLRSANVRMHPPPGNATRLLPGRKHMANGLQFS